MIVSAFLLSLGQSLLCNAQDCNFENKSSYSFSSFTIVLTFLASPSSKERMTVEIGDESDD
jgi:hypothetical protein